MGGGGGGGGGSVDRVLVYLTCFVVVFQNHDCHPKNDSMMKSNKVGKGSKFSNTYSLKAPFDPA